MPDHLKTIEETPDYVQNLLRVLYHEFYQLIEMEDYDRWVITEQRPHRSPEDWQKFRNQINEILSRAGYDGESFAKSITQAKDLELGLTFPCPGCKDDHRDDTHCFDCDHCWNHCTCEQWQESDTSKHIKELTAAGCPLCEGTLKHIQTAGSFQQFKCEGCGHAELINTDSASF